MKRGGVVLSGIALLTVMVLATPLVAGDLNPPGDPAPTMKTLDEIPGSWHRILPASERFVVVMNGAAVLDKETGLVWEKSPGTSTRTWSSDVNYCLGKTAGGRKGWRPPTIEELASLIDPSNSNPALPADHPFMNVQPDLYWSATTGDCVSPCAWGVNFSNGGVGPVAKTGPAYAWCVRAGRGHDGQ